MMAQLLDGTAQEPWAYTAKVADFGLSVKTGPSQKHVSNLRHGTPFYIAPEVAATGHMSMAADSHAFGALPRSFWPRCGRNLCLLARADK